MKNATFEKLKTKRGMALNKGNLDYTVLHQGYVFQTGYQEEVPVYDDGLDEWDNGFVLSAETPPRRNTEKDDKFSESVRLERSGALFNVLVDEEASWGLRPPLGGRCFNEAS